jgi:murein L,D-transpeptidase YafK
MMLRSWPVYRDLDRHIWNGHVQTHNLKLPKNYRDTVSDFYIKVGIAVIAILIIFNVVLLTLFLKERKNNKNSLRILQETNKSLVLLQESLGRTDMQNALVHMTEARRQVEIALPAAPAAAPEKAAAEPEEQTVKQPTGKQKAPAAPVKTAELKIAVDEAPSPLVWATAGEYALIGEKESKLLHLFKFQDERFVLIKSYSCIIGANGEDKKKAGDYATPKGSYFILRYTAGSALPESYGEGAFVLNYPNFLDRNDRKKGTGIWIHGHIPGKVIGSGDLVSTKGCIAVSNESIKELKGLLMPSGAHVSIVDKVAFVKESKRKESLQEIRHFMDAWRQAWGSGDTGKYLSHYSKDFTSSEGMRFEAFRRHKERVNRNKKFIRVSVDQMAIVLPQERERQIAVVRFVQKYRSNNFENDSRKIFYLKKGQAGWTIFGESAF